MNRNSFIQKNDLCFILRNKVMKNLIWCVFILLFPSLCSGWHVLNVDFSHAFEMTLCVSFWESVATEESNLLRIYILRPCLRMTYAECGFLTFIRKDVKIPIPPFHKGGKKAFVQNDGVCHSEEQSVEEYKISILDLFF